MGYAGAGLLPPDDPAELELPDELDEALTADPDLARAFHVGTPGRQKSWVLFLNDARTTATRLSRIN